MPRSKRPVSPNRYRVKPVDLRWRCNPTRFEFKTTSELGDRPINIIGQPRALEALRLGLAIRSKRYNIFVSGQVGSGRSTVVKRMLAEVERGDAPPDDLVFVHNFKEPDQPHRLSFPPGSGKAFREAMVELIESLASDLPKLFESERYRKRRGTMMESVAANQKQRLKKFEKGVQDHGFAVVQIQAGPVTHPVLMPLIDGEPTEMDKLETLAEAGQFDRQALEVLETTLTRLTGQMERLGKELRNLDRDLHRRLEAFDKEMARPLIEEATGEIAVALETDGLATYLDEVIEDILEHLRAFRGSAEAAKVPDGNPMDSVPITREPRYQVNLVVDNSEVKGRPIIWETAPTYRNLFGTVDKVRSEGDWESDHTLIRAGSILRANGGILVLDAMDVMVEPGVWAALKRTMRNLRLEIQLFDPLHVFSGVSLKPEPVPVNVKIVMIGTSHIYRLLYAHDEDFKKIFKAKADFALHTPISDEELENYARFVNKKVKDDDLMPFRREAVAAVVEHGMRLAGNRCRLTTKFTEIADLIREAGYWAAQDRGRTVAARHVEMALDRRSYRLNLIEEMYRERISEGTILLDLEGSKVGQINGLAVLDTGDHVFAQPARITATTAMGRRGIVDIEREAKMSGRIHTKGMLILAGFLNERFAQDKPLTLTASLCFEQNYGLIDGDSASAAELYALLSSLAEVPLRQSLAVTGSVNQRGEIQPIGGVNEKIEGFFDLCRLAGLTGDQGVMIPSRNLIHLMLRKDVQEAVRNRRFNVWAVATIEQGLEVLTGEKIGARRADASWTEGSFFHKVDAKLTRLAKDVYRFGRPEQRNRNRSKSNEKNGNDNGEAGSSG